MNKLKVMNGQEIWTNTFSDRFEERVYVSVKYPYILKSGKRYNPTRKEVNDLWDDYIEQELSSSAEIRKILEEEK